MESQTERHTPLLRSLEGDSLKVCSPGVAILGTPIHTDGEIVIIEGARQRKSGIYLADLSELREAVGGDSVTLALFLDAIAHKDKIRIGVTRDRVTYDNPAQFARNNGGSET